VSAATLPKGWRVELVTDDGLIRLATPEGEIELTATGVWVDKSGLYVPRLTGDTLRLLADTCDLVALLGAAKAAERMLGWSEAA
jgi:hypothetical protein